MGIGLKFVGPVQANGVKIPKSVTVSEEGRLGCMLSDKVSASVQTVSVFQNPLITPQ